MDYVEIYKNCVVIVTYNKLPLRKIGYNSENQTIYKTSKRIFNKLQPKYNFIID